MRRQEGSGARSADGSSARVESGGRKPGAPGHPVEAHWRSLVPTLPVRFRGVARSLPHRLGLSASLDGAWTDFTKLEPMCDLPSFVAEDPKTPGAVILSEASLTLFREAHYRAGYFGLLVDRLADGQALPHPDLARLRPRLRHAWIDALGRALNDRERAWTLVRRSVRAWERALCHEALHRLPARWKSADYGRCIRAKTRWLGVTAAALLEATGQRARVGAFWRAYELMHLALQVLDDGLDATEDRRLYGVSYPDAIGYPPGALVRAATILCERAAGAAREGRFHRLAAWLDVYARRMGETPVEGHPVVTGLGAMVLVGELEVEAS